MKLKMDNFFNKTPNILVIGDLMIDHYLWGKCERISPEAPVQVVDIAKETLVLGGAGNVISNLLSLGAKVDVLSVLGDDETAKQMIKMLKSSKVSTDFLVFEQGRKTSKKSRIIASNHQMIRYDLESRELISKVSEKKLMNNISENIKNYDAILLSDYAKGVLTENFTKFIIDKANKNNTPVLVDPKGDDYLKYKNATLITPNKKEASIATNTPITDDKSLLFVAKKLKNELNLKYSIITLSEDGMAIFDKKLIKVPTIAKEVYDVTGAGDTVLAALGVAFSAGFDIQKSAHFAISAAAVVISKLGSATASLEEIFEYERKTNVTDLKSKILTCKELKSILLKKNNKKIIFTNGCFDILHVGHVLYLQKAKQLGDILIVGLNSDGSISRLKGKNRPINNESDRAVILSALEFIDFVVIFNEDTPYDLIKELKPNVLVKGADYKNKKVVGSDLVDEVVLIDFIEGKSTTSIIDRIKK